MWDMVGYANALLNRPTTRAWLALSLLLTILVTKPIARLLGWSLLGTGVALFSLGGALTVTLANRLAQVGVTWNPEALSVCLNRGGGGPDQIELLLNLVLLVPLGIGLALASHRAVLSGVLVVVAAIGIETLQAVLGLGLCEPSDVLRNCVGGLAGVAVGWLAIRLLGDRMPSYLSRPSDSHSGQTASTDPAADEIVV